MSIGRLKSKIASQSPGRKINQSSNGFLANLSFMLFVFKSIEYRKEHISSGRSDPKCAREKIYLRETAILNGPVQNTLSSSQDMNIFSELLLN